jgi:SAM-dependent methyltransferase
VFDQFRKGYFESLGSSSRELSPNERERIRRTVELVPDDWRDVLDLGCGDGRLGTALLATGRRVVGFDWSASSLRHYPGPKVVGDLRARWPFRQQFDGIICAEVMEHLTDSEVAQLVANLRRFASKGFVLTVPAWERLAVNSVRCPACDRGYHVWGHQRSFRACAEVDALVGSKSVEAKVIRVAGVPPSAWADRCRRFLGWYPHSESYLCPHCGAKLPPVRRFSFVSWTLLRAVAQVERWTATLRPPIGWFACRYGVESK